MTTDTTNTKDTNTSSLLINEYPLIVLPKLAATIGLYEAIILQQLHYWLNKSSHEYDGRVWVYNTIDAWNEQFPFLSRSSVERTLRDLRKATDERPALVLTGNYNKMKADKTLWYSIDYEALRQIEQTITSTGRNDNVQLGEAIPETTTESTPDTNNIVNSNNTDNVDNVIRDQKGEDDLEAEGSSRAATEAPPAVQSTVPCSAPAIEVPPADTASILAEEDRGKLESKAETAPRDAENTRTPSGGRPSRAAIPIEIDPSVPCPAILGGTDMGLDWLAAHFDYCRNN